ncbi:hypothetical protein LTR84_003014 [Exophiala bonariae]|uniref:Uncharacterized protein n=1 Tax=Exophiala bonariae TaxID=1690606 RepID=A0AAV9N9U2_9EURO|nr:hypothetical protein LTR84_003014 [Exophiala bonariae]
MSSSVTNKALVPRVEPSKSDESEHYIRYLIMHGIRYLTQSMPKRKILFQQFLQLFTAAFKVKSKFGKHGYIWQLDYQLIDYLIPPIYTGFVPGLMVRRMTPDGKEAVPFKSDQPPPSSQVVCIVSEELDEDYTIRLIAKFLFMELLQSYDPKWPEWNGMPSGEILPVLIGKIELIGLYKSGASLPAYVVQRLRKEVATPRIHSNLLIAYECDCPEHFRPSPKVDKCYLCSHLSPQNRKLEPEAYILRDRILLVRGADPAHKPITTNLIDKFDLNRARQRLISGDLDPLGTIGLRLTATDATWNNQIKALEFTTYALDHAGFDVSLWRAVGKLMDRENFESFLAAHLGSSGEEFNQEVTGTEGGKFWDTGSEDGEGQSKGKKKDKAKEVHHVRYFENQLAVHVHNYATAHKQGTGRELHDDLPKDPPKDES